MALLLGQQFPQSPQAALEEAGDRGRGPVESLPGLIERMAVAVAQDECSMLGLGEPAQRPGEAGRVLPPPGRLAGRALRGRQQAPQTGRRLARLGLDWTL